MNGRLTLCAWSIASVVLLWTSANINWGGDHWRTVLQADAKGYYAYLPAILIYGDPNMGFFDPIEREKYYNPDLFYDYRAGHEGRIISKYPAGTAVMQMPFFLVAHGIAHLPGGDPDGFSKPYVVAVNLAAIAWVLVGLYFLAQLLREFGVADGWTAITLLAFVFGTNLFYYTVVAPGMSHAYGFGAITAFLYYGRLLGREVRPSHLLILAILFGLIILIRPVNALILLALPALWDAPMITLRKTWTQGRSLLASVVLTGLIVGIQLLYYKVATGDWLVYSYGEERFQWSDPHFLDMLLSYRKGLFIYTPLTLLSLLGLRYWWTISRSAVPVWSVFFVLLTYVLSSWWNWWYGGSFGSRVYVEYLALFAVPFALALQHMQACGRKVYLVVTILLVLFCQVQTIQARYYLIHWEDMDSERYWEEFMRIDRLP